MYISHTPKALAVARSIDNTIYHNTPHFIELNIDQYIYTKPCIEPMMMMLVVVVLLPQTEILEMRKFANLHIFYHPLQIQSMQAHIAETEIANICPLHQASFILFSLLFVHSLLCGCLYVFFYSFFPSTLQCVHFALL